MIVFSSTRRGLADLYVIDRDGSQSAPHHRGCRQQHEPRLGAVLALSAEAERQTVCANVSDRARRVHWAMVAALAARWRSAA